VEHGTSKSEAPADAQVRVDESGSCMLPLYDDCSCEMYEKLGHLSTGFWAPTQKMGVVGNQDGADPLTATRVISLSGRSELPPPASQDGGLQSAGTCQQL